MKEDKVLILEREDLNKGCEKLSISSITYYNFKVSVNQKCLSHGLVLFIDDNGQTKILKNRYGYNGGISFKKH